MERMKSWIFCGDNIHVNLAKMYYLVNEEKRHYHNWNHVVENHNWLVENEGFIPDRLAVNLYFANLWHDAVYDDKPFKEKRSADAFYKIYSNPVMDSFRESQKHLNIDTVYRLILETEDHIFNDTRWMVAADLHQFADEKLRERNRLKLYNEAIALYGIDKATYKENSVAFLKGLLERVESQSFMGLYIAEGLRAEIHFLQQRPAQLQSNERDINVEA